MRSLFALAFTAVLAACGSSNRLADGTMLGTMTTGSVPLVTIDGKEMRMAPGARIMTPSNTSVTPNQVPPNSRVRYKVDASGQISQVWLLPPEK
ncbi:MAG: hypothetical protein WBA53_06475 [Burkholderiaceae bacterium]